MPKSLLLLIFLILNVASCNGRSDKNVLIIPPTACEQDDQRETCKPLIPDCPKDQKFDAKSTSCVALVKCQVDEIWEEATQSCNLVKDESCPEGSTYNKEQNICEAAPIVPPPSPQEQCTSSGFIWDMESESCLKGDDICPNGACNELKTQCESKQGFWLEEVQGCYQNEEVLCKQKNGEWSEQTCSIKINCLAPLKWSPYHYECINEDFVAYGIKDGFDVAKYNVQSKDHIFLFSWMDAINDLVITTAYPVIEVIKIEKSTGKQVWAKSYGNGQILHEAINVKLDSHGDLVFVGNRKAFYDSSPKDDDIVYGKINGETGELIWSQMKFGTLQAEEARVVLIQDNGDYLILGNTKGALTGRLLGLQDIFIRSVNALDGSTNWEFQGFSEEWESLEYAAIKDNKIVFTHFTYDDLKDNGETKISIFDIETKAIEKTKIIGKSSKFRLKEFVIEGDALYVGGYTATDFIYNTFHNNTDAIFAKLSYPDLEYVWKQQKGSSGWDYIYHAASAKGDYIYFSGITQGELWTDGSRKIVPESKDGIVAKVNKFTGEVNWIRRMIGNSPAVGNISTGPRGELYFSNVKRSGLLSTGLGDFDVYISRLAPEDLK